MRKGSFQYERKITPMLSITLTKTAPSSTKRFVTSLTFERRNNTVTPVRKFFTFISGQKVCTGSRVEPWPRKDWCPLPTGEVGSHGRPFIAKRDWYQIHAALEHARLSEKEAT